MHETFDEIPTAARRSRNLGCGRIRDKIGRKRNQGSSRWQEGAAVHTS